MGKYTQTLREIAWCMMMEKGTKSCTNEQLVDECVSNFFDNYPIFNESYRDHLNRNIVRHFFMREVGYETYALWRFEFNNKLNEVMPFFNKLYEEIDTHNLFDDTDLWDVNDNSRASQSNRDTTGKEDTKSGRTQETNELSGSEHLGSASSKDSGTDETIHTYDSYDTMTDTQNKEHKQLYQKNYKNVENYTKGSSEKETKTGTDTVNIGTPPSITRTSDTPQGTIADLKAGKYLTEVTITDSNGTTATPTTYNTTVAHTGSPAEKTVTYTDTNGSMDVTTDRVTQGNVKNAKDGTDTDTTTHGLKNDSTDKSTDYSNKRSDLTGNETGLKNYGENEKVLTGEEESSERHTKGKAGGKPYIELLNDFYSKAITVELMLFEELENCFMQIW